MRIHNARFGALAALLLVACTSTTIRPAIPAELHGSWVNRTADSGLDLSAGRILYREKQTTVVVQLLEAAGDAAGGAFLVRKYGARERWLLRREGERLVQEVAGRRTEFEPGTARLSVDTIEIGQARPLPPERIAEIQAEIARRLAEEQAIRKDRARRAELPPIDAANKAYLTTLVREIGWIDAGRFGEKTSSSAVILAKHSGDLGVVSTILPYVEKDFGRPGDEAQSFAITYDDVHLKLGGKQRYGSQVCRDADGQPFVCALETPSQVDDRRASIGLPPLEGYLAEVGKLLFEGKTVRIPNDQDEQ
jgi:hypothetical protein